MIVNGLKGSNKKNNGKSVATLAREAIRWAQEALRSDDGSIKAQAKNETTDEDAIGDDAILACCLYLRSTHHVSLPITLLTNDNNLSMKAQANGILALSGLSPNNETMSSDVLIRQVLNGPLPQEKTYIRPKEGEDTRMLDLSGTAEDKLPFLPGLEASRFAPKSQANGKMKPAIAIDPETGAVILLEEGQRPPNHHVKNYKELANLLAHGDTNFDVDGFGKHPEEGQTYADIMASRKEHSQRHSGDDEMEWE